MASVHGVALGSGHAGRPREGHLLVWGVVGLISQAAFMAGWVITETWQGPGYSPITATISDMQAATAPHVWFPVACFAAGGAGSFCFAIFGLRPALASAGKICAYAPWMLAFSALALGNSFPLIPCQLGDPGCTPHSQLYSPGGLTDAIVATLAFLVLAFTPSALWARLKVLPQWRQLKPVMMTAKVICPLCFNLLWISAATGIAQGLAERILTTSCVLWMSALVVTLISVSRHTELSL